MNKEFLKMQKLAGLITENQMNKMLNEDILELKQIAKQLFAFLKQKGFEPTLEYNSNTINPKKIGSDNYLTQILVNEKPDERALVAVSPRSVAKAMVGGGNDWDQKAAKEFGPEFSSDAVSAKSNWFKNPKIISYINKLGEEMLKQILTKYPNMIYGFSQQGADYYVLEFKFKETAKGGTVNPNQRPNAPKPTV